MFDRARVTAHLVRAARLFSRAPRPRRLPVQQPPTLIEREYARAIIELVVPRVRAAFAPLMRELPALLERAAAERLDGARFDAGEGKRLRELVDSARDHLRKSVSTEDIERLAHKFAQQTSTHQRVQLARQTKAALGVDVVGSDRRMPAIVENFVANNVSLVRGISDKLAQKTERLVTEAVTRGELAGDLAEKLQKIGYGERESALIARDQIGKLNGQLNAVRQKDLGVDEFIWRCVGDERVRDEHEAIDGETYKFSEGGHPIEGLPGEPVLCRCWAEPVFDAVLDELDDSATPEPGSPIDDPKPAPVEPPTPIAAPKFAPAAEAKPVEVPKNPKRVAAAKVAAAASAERRREIHSAALSNLSQELRVVWEKEGHKFMREESGRIKGVKDRVNAASTLSQAFAEKYGENPFGHEGDRAQRASEIVANHAEEWADEQTRKHYEALQEAAERDGAIDDKGELTEQAQVEPVPQPLRPWEIDDDDPPF